MSARGFAGSLTHADRFNVEDSPYGAVGDGVTDDTAAIQAAIDAADAAGGGVVVFPAGKTYLVTPVLHSQALVARPNVILWGYGATIKVSSTAARFASVIDHNSVNDVSGFQVHGLTFDGNSASNDLAADTVILYEWNASIRIQTGANIHIRDCHFTNVDSINTIILNGGAADGTYRVFNASVIGCTFSNIGGDVFHDHSTVYTDARSVVISGNNFTGRLTSGVPSPSAVCAIETHGSSTTVIGNTVRDMQHGINLTGVSYQSDNYVCTGNTMTRVMQGINLFSINLYSGAAPGSQGAIVQGNSILLDPDFHAPVHEQACHGIYWVSTQDDESVHTTIHDNAIRFRPYTGSSTTVAQFISGGIVFNRSGGTTNPDREISIMGNTISGALSIGIAMTGIKAQGVQISGNIISDCGHSAVSVTSNRNGIYLGGNFKNTRVAANLITDFRSGGAALTENGIFWAGDSSSADNVIRDNQIKLTSASTPKEIWVAASSGGPLVIHRVTSGNVGAPTNSIAYGSRWVISTGVEFVQVGAPTGVVWVQTTNTFSAKTAAYTLLPNDLYISADATSAAFTVTLPTAAGITGKVYTIKRINSGANNVTIGTTSSQTIDGASTYTLSAQWAFVSVVSNGANWFVVSS